MSFFKKIKAELREMLADDDDKDKEKEKEKDKDKDKEKEKEKHKDQSGPYGQDHTKDISYQGAPTSYGQPEQPQPYQQYGNTGPPGQYGNGPPQPGQYGNGPPPPGGQLPPGWISQWDQNSQRYYYVEQATGRTQWELPMWQGGPPAPPPGGPGYYQSYGHAMPAGMPYQQGHDENQRAYYGDVQSNEKKEKKDKKDKKDKQDSGMGMGTVVAAGVGGAALGALATAALSDSDDDHRAAPAPPPAAPYGYGAPPADPYGYGAPPPAAAPVALEDNPALSSSQRSSLEEARKDYEEAQRKVDEEGSDASSSDLEELHEARQEYLSEVESAHSELED